jgi:hypothetical protein
VRRVNEAKALVLAVASGYVGTILEAQASPNDQSRRQAGPMALWFSHEWEIRDKKKPFSAEPLRLQVKLFKTPGRQLAKAGEQSVLKIYRSGKVIFCSDENRQCKDSICFGEPVSIVRVGDNKMAIITQGPTAYIGRPKAGSPQEAIPIATR